MAEATMGASAKTTPEEKESLWKDVWYSLSHNMAAMVSLVFILLLVVIAIVTKVFPGIVPCDPYAQDL